MTKQCTRCKEEKEESEYYLRPLGEAAIRKEHLAQLRLDTLKSLGDSAAPAMLEAAEAEVQKCGVRTPYNTCKGCSKKPTGKATRKTILERMTPERRDPIIDLWVAHASTTAIAALAGVKPATIRSWGKQNVFGKYVAERAANEAHRLLRQMVIT